MMTRWIEKYPLLVPMLWVLVFEAISAMIGIATQPGVDGWYEAAAKPWFTPPNIVFPIMWSFLYVLIALGGYRLWKNRAKPGGRLNLVLFASYIALNWSWSFLFFSAQMIALGAIWIIAMNIISALLILRNMRHDRVTALLLILPLAWTSFAFLLNFAYL